MDSHSWKKCSSCKSEIPYQTKYWTCNVSTCNQKRTGWVFCKVECWDAHVPKMNHRESWALESISPSQAQWKLTLAEMESPSQPKKKSEPSVPTKLTHTLPPRP